MAHAAVNTAASTARVGGKRGKYHPPQRQIVKRRCQQMRWTCRRPSSLLSPPPPSPQTGANPSRVPDGGAPCRVGREYIHPFTR